MICKKWQASNHSSKAIQQLIQFHIQQLIQYKIADILLETLQAAKTDGVRLKTRIQHSQTIIKWQQIYFA